MQNKILIVEDELIVAFDIRIRLNKAGFNNVELSASGEEAIELAAKYKPDIVFMDLKLDGTIDGVDAACSISNICGAKIVYLSGNTDCINDERVLKTQPLAFLPKPIDERQLFALLNSTSNLKQDGSLNV
jgi:CheY-like chemotaxis protein